MQTTKQLRFKIQQLRQDKIIFAIESIAVIVFALFVSAFLPNLLLRYFYAKQNLTEVPPSIEYIPVVAFVVGVGYFLFAMVTNLGRWDQVKRLEKQLDDVEMGDGCGCCGCDSCEPSSMDSKTESVGLLAEKMKSTKKRKAAKRN